MSEGILHKIKYLCKKIPKVEWSGILFYSVEGSITNPKEMKCILQDILPLDMGTSAFTSYELDDRFIDYMMENPEAMDWTVGHIHSHNVMGVFFSGTDMSELNDNAPSHNYYLSLIVNNYMEFVAKIAFVGGTEKLVKQIPYSALDENGKQYNIQKVDLNYKKEKLFVYDCIIVSPQEQIMVEDGFAGKVDEIMKPKPSPAVVQTTFTPGKVTPGYNPNFNPNKTPVHQAVSKAVKTFPKVDINKVSDRSKAILHTMDKIPFDTFEDLYVENLTPLEKFTAELMNFTSPIGPKENLEDVLGVLEDMELDSYQIAMSVIENYAPLYDKFFGDADDEEFIEDTYDVIGILEDELLQFPFINVTIEAIKTMVKNFEENVGQTV